jgi:hypothetical protein
MNALLTHGITFIAGAATGAASSYFGGKRREEQNRRERKLFREAMAVMPDLMRQLRDDVASYETRRNFCIVPPETVPSVAPSTLVYVDDGRNGYLRKARTLESYGYVVDIASGDTPTFRMENHFVRLLKLVGDELR